MLDIVPEAHYTDHLSLQLVIYGKLGFERRGQTHIVSPLGECEMYCLSKKATA
jgi:hypothetical protein